MAELLVASRIVAALLRPQMQPEVARVLLRRRSSAASRLDLGSAGRSVESRRGCYGGARPSCGVVASAEELTDSVLALFSCRDVPEAVKFSVLRTTKSGWCTRRRFQR